MIEVMPRMRAGFAILILLAAVVASCAPGARDRYENLPERQRVVDVQNRLSKLGYNPGPADGVLGPNTRKSIRRFQTNNRMPSDGKLSADLYAAVHSFGAARASQTAARSQRTSSGNQRADRSKRTADKPLCVPTIKKPKNVTEVLKKLFCNPNEKYLQKECVKRGKNNYSCRVQVLKNLRSTLDGRVVGRKKVVHSVGVYKEFGEWKNSAYF